MGEFLKFSVTHIHFTVYNEISIFHSDVQKHVFVCRITQKIFDTLWTMLGNGWKCILNCVSWLVSPILNFNGLCIAFTVQRHYTVSLRNNRICYLILGIFFGNYFLTVYNEIKDHLRLYFVYFLNHNVFMKKFIAKFLHRGI